MDAKEYLTVAISGEQLAVSYAMLSRKFDITPKQARQVLAEYVDSNKSDSTLHVTYCLRGVKKHGVATIELCDGSEIDTKRAEFNEPVSQLIYSVSASPTTTAILYDMALEASAMGSNGFAIVSTLAEGVDLTPSKPVVKDDSPPVFVKPIITTAPAKKPAPKQKPKLDFFGGKKDKKGESVKEVKEEEKDDKKEGMKEEKKDGKDVKKEDKKEPESVKTESTKAESTKKAEPSKTPPKSVLDAVKKGKKNEPKPKEPAPKSKKQLETEVAEKQRQKELEAALFADEDEDFDVPIKKPAAKETIKEELQEDLDTAKKQTEEDAQKIAGGELDVVTEDVEMGDDDGKNDDNKEDVEMTDVHMTNDGEDVHATTTTASTKTKRGKKKVVKKVQELDEDGYVTYKKVETWESCDEDEDETGMKEEVKKEVKKETKMEAKKEAKKTESPEPTTGAKKGKKANKQSSLMSFFKK